MVDPIPAYRRVFAELKRRNVFRVVAVYGIVGFVLLQIADLVVPALLLPDWVYRLVALILLLGLPVAVVLAWALELTPDGLRRTADATPGELTDIVTAPASQRWPAGVLALAGITMLLAGAWYLGRQSASTSNADRSVEAVVASIAVLPFADMSPEGDQEYFSDGLAEELLGLLSRMPGLLVAARTSSFSFKEQDLAVQEIAARLHVTHVLEGSVRQAEDQLRIGAQLVRAEDGFHVWSRTWDRSFDDIFEIQREIASEVAAQLELALLGGPLEIREKDPEAYALFLQARHLGRLRAAESLEQSNALYRQALEIDPDYGEAWVGLARNYISQSNTGLKPLDEGYRLAREGANRALALNPESADAHAVLSLIAEMYDRDLATAVRRLQEALLLDPNNPAILSDAGALVWTLGRLEEAGALLEQAVARSPVDPAVHSRLGTVYLSAGRIEDAIASFRSALALNPGGIRAHYNLGVALLHQGEYAAALAALQRESADGWRLIGSAMAYHALGQPSEANAALQEMIDTAGEYVSYNIAYVLAFWDEADRAFEWLDRSIAHNDPALSTIAVETLFQNIHDDPRWLPFLESVGRSPAQLAAIELDVESTQ